MSIQVTYPHDPSAVMDVCLIKDENHVIITNDNSYRVIVPELAPFFKLNLVIVHAISGLVLSEGTDYNLGYKLIDAAKIANRELFGAIVITNPNLKGEFVLEYRTVGGNYVGIQSAVLKHLADLLTDPAKVYFENILDRPSYSTPVKHEQHYADFANKESLAASIDEISSALDSAAAESSVTALDDIKGRIKALDDYLTSVRYDLHIKDKTNPHNETAKQVGALELNADAVDAFSVYGRSLVELAEYINSRGITQTDIDAYLHTHSSSDYSGDLILKDGKSVLRNEAGTTEIDLSNGNITIKSELMSELFVDSTVSKADERIVLQSGLNVLEIISSGTNGFGTSTLRYNGHVVLDANNAAGLLAGITSGGMVVVTNDTSTIKWSGQGTEASPLEATLTLPEATTTVAGGVKLSNTRTASGSTTAPTSYVINEIRKDLTNKLDGTVKVNGQPLSSNPVLDKDDLYLDKVDNTSDANKPISAEQEEHIDLYSDIGHTHTGSDIAFPIATGADKGIMRLVDSLDDDSLDGAVATPALIQQLNEDIVDLETLSARLMPSDVLDVRYWEPIEEVTCDGVTITFPEGALLYMQQVEYSADTDLSNAGAVLDFAALFPTNYTNQTFYIYIGVEEDAIIYWADRNKLANSGPQMHIATVRLSNTDVMDMSDVNGGVNTYESNIGGILQVKPVTSVGIFRELVEHTEDDNPHSGVSLNLSSNSIGLDLVNNYRAVTYMSDASHQGVKYWDILSTFSPANFQATASDITIKNGSIDLNIGSLLELPLTSGTNQLVLFRNPNFEFNDPDRARTTSTGDLQRYVEYTLNVDNSAVSTPTVETWGIVLGSYIDPVGLVHDILFLPRRVKGAYVGFSLLYYINGVEEEVLFNHTPTITGSDDNFVTLTASLEYTPTAVGFKYSAVVVYTAVTETRTFRLDLDISNSEAVIDFYAYLNTAVAPDVLATKTLSLTSGYVKNVLLSGTIGFGGYVSSTGSADTFQMTVDARRSYEIKQDERYVSAAAVYQALKDGCNMYVATGTLAVGETLPELPHAAKTIVYTGLTQLGTTDSTAAIDTFTASDGKVEQSVLNDNTKTEVPSTFMIIGYRNL